MSADRPAGSGAVRPRRVAIVGGGISGLSAAWFLRRRTAGSPSGTPVEITVFEASGRFGGALESTTLGGALPITADVGAEAALARRPEALALAGDLGLAVERPGTAGSRIYARGALHPIPAGNLMGVPSDPAAALGLLDEAEVARAIHETITDPVAGDVSVGGWVAGRLGDAVADRLVDPLLGGVYAGDAWRLSLQATVPALWPVAVEGRSLLAAAAAQADSVARAARARAETGLEPAPVFMGLAGGLTGLVEALESRLGRPEPGAPAVAYRKLEAATELMRSGDGGWTLDTSRGAREEFDSVIVALPAHRAAALLTAAAPEAARGLAGIDHASSAVVTALVDVGDAPLTGSGFLVPPSQTDVIKASTFSSNKWPWLAAALPPGTAVVRASAGRFGAQGALAHDDGDLAAEALADLERILGRALPARVVEVKRWEKALPQYSVGHVERIQRITDAVDAVARLAVAGAAYGGVGIPACIESGERAAASIADELERMGS